MKKPAAACLFQRWLIVGVRILRAPEAAEPNGRSGAELTWPFFGDGDWWTSRYMVDHIYSGPPNREKRFPIYILYRFEWGSCSTRFYLFGDI